MKASIAISIFLAAGVVGQAQGACPGTQVTNMEGTLSGRMVCAYKTDQDDPNDRWSEVHTGSGTSGTLTEWARGPGDTVDPPHVVGNWSINDDPGTDTVSYSYTGDSSSPYVYTLYDNAGQYYFCDSGSNPAATVKKFVDTPSGDNPCDWTN